MLLNTHPPRQQPPTSFIPTKPLPVHLGKFSLGVWLSGWLTHWPVLPVHQTPLRSHFLRETFLDALPLCSQAAPLPHLPGALGLECILRQLLLGGSHVAVMH